MIGPIIVGVMLLGCAVLMFLIHRAGSRLGHLEEEAAKLRADEKARREADEFFRAIEEASPDDIVARARAWVRPATDGERMQLDKADNDGANR